MSRSHVMTLASTLASALLLASSASAFSGGQFGYSGKDNSCLACHGSETYPAISVAFTGADTASCVLKDGAFFTIPVIDYEAQVTLTLTLAKPEGDEVPGCPTACDATLCGTDGDPCEHMYQVNGYCPVGADICDAALAGFNAELDSAVGLFEASDDGTRVISNGSIPGPLEVQDPEVVCDMANMGTECDDENGYACTMRPGDTTVCARSGSIPLRDGSQITHRIPKQTVSSDATWDFKYTAPSKADADAAGDRAPAGIYIGANVANGNGVADLKDKNANVVFAVALRDADGSVVLPEFCGVCDDGQAPDATGQCPACACASTHAAGSGGTASGAALAGLAALLVLRRRRRR